MPPNITGMKKYLLLVMVLFLCACQAEPMAGTATPTQPPPQPTSTPSPTVTPTSTVSPTSEPSLTPTPVFKVCSPLEDETFASLREISYNTLDIPPNFGMDDGHHGVDFAYYLRGDRTSIEGIEIYAIMSGKTVLTLEDDRPYGYTLLIETPLDNLPDTLQNLLMSGYLPVPEDPHYRLTCPEVPLPVLTGEYAVYHLYAHMEALPVFTRGEKIACGEKLGTVGNTGYSSAPHLHLETRLGPAGAQITNMAHYEGTQTAEQWGNYCLWRMSGYYQLFDPFILFDAVE
jgi:murein DD-endopeptidase MepM/ murein hydrolase activator NlpD